MASEERRISESAIPQETYSHKIGALSDLSHVTCGKDYVVSESEGPEETFRMVLELSDNMPDKADLLDSCGAGFYRNVLRNTNKKEDIDNCILAYGQQFILPLRVIQTCPVD